MSNLRQKKGGAKLSRSEIITVRLDPKLRYLAELASRKQRRTLSSFIEWSIEEVLKKELVDHGSSYEEPKTFYEQAERLWDVDEIDRLSRLAACYPYLLNYEEQLIWKFLQEFSVYDHNSKMTLKFVSHSSRELDVELVRKFWDEINGVVKGSFAEAELKKLIIDYIPF